MHQVKTWVEDMVSMSAVRDDTWIKLRKLYRQLGAPTEIEVLHHGTRSQDPALSQPRTCSRTRT
ncbi:hypothetical protein EC957_005541, partial [Mortierella hygrophila]